MSEIRALTEATCQIDAAMEALQDYTIDDDVHAAWMALNGINILLENRLRSLLASDIFYNDEAVEQRRIDALARVEKLDKVLGSYRRDP